MYIESYLQCSLVPTIHYIYIYIHKVCKLNNETDFLFTKVFIFFKHQCYLFQNSSLEKNGDIVPTYGSSAGNLQPVWS